MTDHAPSRPNDPKDDQVRKKPGNAFDAGSGYSGQDYRHDREAAEGAERPSGHPLTGDPATMETSAADPDGRDIPPDNGRRGWIDPATGEVHGSGAGAGGGNAGEDFDDETPAGG